MLTWPAELSPLSGGYAQFVRSLTGGPSLSGIEQVQSQLQDRWSAQFSFAINSTPRLLALRALLSQLRGRAGSVALPVFERSRAPWPSDAYGRVLTPKVVRTRDLDGTPYADADSMVAALIAASTSVPAFLNATSIDVTMTTGGTPLPGHIFGIGTRVYQINTVITLSPAHYRFGIWPWLRVGVAENSAVNFITPACEMRLASDEEGSEALRSLEQMRLANVTLRFDEVA